MPQHRGRGAAGNQFLEMAAFSNRLHVATGMGRRISGVSNWTPLWVFMITSTLNIYERLDRYDSCHCHNRCRRDLHAMARRSPMARSRLAL